jgi:hypothetical protein
MSRFTRLFVLAALLAVCSWPWIGGLHLWPMAPDSGTWIAKSAPTSPDWVEWVFATRQFNVGWRPLTGLTYTLDFLIGELDPWIYRVTDLVLHLGAAAALYAVMRRLAADRPAWTALVAAALFLTHPSTEEVVPFIARRSYALSSALGLAAVATFHASLRGRAPLALAAGVLLAMAVLANEVAVLYAAALPFVALTTAPADRRGAASAARACILPAIPVIIAVAVRLSVVGGLGGYRLPESVAERAWPVFEAYWRGIAGVPGLGSGLIASLLLAAAAYYAWQARRGLPLVLAVWGFAHGVLFASQGVWFPRQAYVAIVPLAMLAALVLGRTLQERRGTQLALHLAPQLLVLGTLLVGSPVLRGPEPERIADWEGRQRMLDRMLEMIDTVEEPSTFHLVLPYRTGEDRPDAIRATAAERELPRVAKQPVKWMRTLLQDRDVELEEFVYFHEEEGQDDLPAIHVKVAIPLVAFPSGRTYFMRSGPRFERRDSSQTPRAVLPLPGGGRNELVYAQNRTRGEMEWLNARERP